MREEIWTRFLIGDRFGVGIVALFFLGEFKLQAFLWHVLRQVLVPSQNSGCEENRLRTLLDRLATVEAGGEFGKAVSTDRVTAIGQKLEDFLSVVADATADATVLVDVAEVFVAGQFLFGFLRHRLGPDVQFDVVINH